MGFVCIISSLYRTIAEAGRSPWLAAIISVASASDNADKSGYHAVGGELVMHGRVVMYYVARQGAKVRFLAMQ